MSLQVWLPLLGNINNQGLANLTHTSGTPVYKTAGKIGQCLDLKTQVSFNCPNLNGIKKFSIAFWAKVNEDTSLTSNWVDVIGFTDKKSDGTTGQLRWETCYASGYETRGISSHDNTTYAIFNAPGTLSSPKGIWYHIVLTVGENVKEYRDGILQYTGTYNGGSLTGTFWLGQTNVVNGEINDVRIYDHALSEKEVKELSKGLVLHYKLDGKNETTTNLVTTEDGLSSTAYNAAVGKYGYNADSNMQKEVGDFNGRHCTKVSMITAGVSARPYVYFSNLFVSNGTDQSEYKTLSFDYYGTIGTYINFYKLGSGSGTGAWKNTTLGQSGNWTNSGDIMVKSNEWNHIELTLHGTTDANAEFGYCILGNTHTTSADNYWLFANVQIETKDHATPYAGVSGSRTYTTEYDCSGYNYDGTITGTLVSSSDTPRYNASTIFSGSQYITIGNQLYNMRDEMTINIWAYKENWANASGNPFSSVESGGFGWQSSGANWVFYMGTGASSNTYLSSTVTVNNLSSGWHMLSATYDGLALRTYVDGALRSTVSKYTTKTPIFYNVNSGMFVSGESAGSLTKPSGSLYTGQLSDLRIYATALSDEDILELYHTSASIDNKGNMYAYEVME